MGSNPVNKSNIQGGIWPRMPKEFESYLFYKISNVDRFRNDLRDFIGNITTGLECEELLAKIKLAQEAGISRKIPKSCVNVAFTQKGLEKVCAMIPCCIGAELNDGLYEKGMYSDLIFEGADIPERLLPEFKPPPEHDPAKDDDSWRCDLVLIVAASCEKTLNEGIARIETNFHLRDMNKNSLDLVVAKHGQRRPGDFRGREHFGFEDHISQPQIQGLDPEPGPREPLSCLPGYIFVGHDGDPRQHNMPPWSYEGSFLVFRQLDEKVPEFNNFIKEAASKIPNYQGDNGAEKLAAHLMGRWKSGAPVALTPDHDDPKLAFRNDFDFRPKQSIMGCPFAAHARKMRPRADHKRDLGKDDDFVAGQFTDPLVHDTSNPPDLEEDSDEEPDQTPDKEDASVILRRGITFGPELGLDEKEKTTKSRGVYFTCYQSDIRDGFNLLMTRWASNSFFPTSKKRTHQDGPGMDPFTNQRQRKDHPEGHISLFDGVDTKKTHKLDLGTSPWVDQRGGEYFFTPSIRGLHWFCNGKPGGQSV
ncbi:uncharacterized protein N7515_001373 [Penicillium bovifimosum]|uniref:DyP dimeric alpha+beta barrel domain-containing protein n=1 Tax=Penicillium bovifimosum TaxID=126998 RepID=A0A9W9H9J8_9EURO|nr:uncharacterized protein N7515_001373 [Penicillium bovifimosum]KAJ5142586.1 hypothetical protein N7515_001373 [Penicillium bovifimosum]